MHSESEGPSLQPATVTVSAGRPPHQPDAPLNTPLTPASVFVAGGEREYGRYANPTWEAFETVLGRLEGGRALAFASGLAAVAAIVDLVAAGEVVVAPRHAYLGVLQQLAAKEQRGQLKVKAVDVSDTAEVVSACEDAALVWLESPTNPALEVADIESIAAAAHAAGARVVVDNTFATPLLQRPLDLGADIVLHSATKYLAGHSDAVLGALVTRDEESYAALDAQRRLLGAIPGRWRCGSPPAASAPCTCVWSGHSRTREPSSLGCGSIRRSRRCAIPASAVSWRSSSPAVPPRRTR